MAATDQESSLNRASNPLFIMQKVGVDAWLRAHGKVVRPELTKKQKQEMKECFDLIDADGSGAIDAEEMVTAFNVLGMRVRKSEVETLLAEVDADGSGEVEYPEFVQIMTSKLDSQMQESDPEEKPKKQTLPFQLLAQAYRRKKLMEAVMGGDKTAQERLRAKAEEAEAERLAVLAAMEAEKENPRLKRAEARRKLEREEAIPEYIVEHLDDELKQTILESCGQTLCQKGVAEINYSVKPSSGHESTQEMSQMILNNLKDSFPKHKLCELGKHRIRVNFCSLIILASDF